MPFFQKKKFSCISDPPMYTCIQWCMGDRFHSESFFWKKDNTCHNY